MGNIAKVVNKYLRALYDIEHEIYKSVISDENGIASPTVNNPMDYNIGAIAGVLEWNRNLTLSLINQLFLNQATGKFLNLQAHDQIGIVRYYGESDVDYAKRVADFIIAPKISPASIIYYLRPYSEDEPIILEGRQDSMFADVSFSDNITEFQIETPGQYFEHWVSPAIAGSAATLSYYFIVILKNTLSGDVQKVMDIIDRWVASGINYEVQITYS